MMNTLLPSAILDLGKIAEVVTLEKGVKLKKQFETVSHFYLLLEGTVHFHQLIATDGEEILAGKSHSPYAPIGLDAFISPYRNETTAIVASSSAKLIKWETQALTSALRKCPEVAINFFKFVNHHSNRFIGDTSGLFSSGSATIPLVNKGLSVKGLVSPKKESPSDKVLFLLQSAFFEVFEEEYLLLLTTNMESRKYRKGDLIIDQGEIKKGAYILESGEVQYARSIFDVESGKKCNVSFRSISTPGYLISSSALLGVESAMNAFATKDSTVRYIPWGTLSKAFETHAEFELHFQKRALWLINNQLRAVRTRFITSQLNDEQLVATTLISGNNTKISVQSALHQIPALLSSKSTIPKALDILHQVELNGKPAEKNLASLCLDNLQKTQKESTFYQALLNIYEVTENSENKSNKEIQESCIIACKKAFSVPSIFIKGLENIPSESGCIFIYNHLNNDEYYTLPNHFQITLDSHFLGYLLYEMYGEQAKRVVRIGKREEFGHENYYNKFDFINVITRDSDESDQGKDQKSKTLKSFNEQIKKALQEKKNIIISPEGISHTTEMSPGPFKSGIFKLIQNLDFEPWIVPVVMANFDKRITDKKLACEIKKPFKLSSKLKPYKDDQIRSFLKDYQQEYRDHVKQLVSSIEIENITQLEFDQEVKTLRRRVLPKRKEKGIIAFYGSSTLRLWETLQSDLENKKATNFAFGGSTYEWCLHYFDQIFKGIHPRSFVLYGGDNDLANGRSVDEILRAAHLLIDKIKTHTPDASIAIISVKPSPSRAHLQSEITNLNIKLKALVEFGQRLYWIETHKYMINEDGKAKTEYFIEDMLHLNKNGYECWSRAVRQQLEAYGFLETS